MRIRTTLGHFGWALLWPLRAVIAGVISDIHENRTEAVRHFLAARRLSLVNHKAKIHPRDLHWWEHELILLDGEKHDAEIATLASKVLWTISDDELDGYWQ
jgi:hypothetical protein